MTTDVDVLQEMFSSGVMTLVSDFVMVFWIIGIMFYLHVRVGPRFAGADPADGARDQFFSRQGAQTYRQIRERIARINAYLAEAISGMAVIQIFRPRRENLSRIRRSQRAPPRRLSFIESL